MSFDPYYKWLGIPPIEQPPNYYRLLGISVFESDPDVIDAAANRQMAYLQNCATDPHLPLSQKLLNEVAAARLCLLSAETKDVYDRMLTHDKSMFQARTTTGPTRREPLGDQSERQALTRPIATHSKSALKTSVDDNKPTTPNRSLPKSNGSNGPRRHGQFGITNRLTALLTISVLLIVTGLIIFTIMPTGGPRTESRPSRRIAVENPIDATGTSHEGVNNSKTTGPRSTQIASTVMPKIQTRTFPPPVVKTIDRTSELPKRKSENSTKTALNPDARIKTSIDTVPRQGLSELGEKVDQAIRGGVRYLLSLQHPNGSWSDVESEAKTGTTSLITLALLSAGEGPGTPTIRKALEYLRGFGPDELHSTYAVALQTMVFAAAEPERDISRIAKNVSWLERAQIKRGDPVYWPGSWTYSDSKRARPGDNSNTQYALLGLQAASEAGVTVKPEVWELAGTYWKKSQKRDGSWAYTPVSTQNTASMTCAAIASLIITGAREFQDNELLRDETIKSCGKGLANRNLQDGIDWLAKHFYVNQNLGFGQRWTFYYLCGLERRPSRWFALLR